MNNFILHRGYHDSNIKENSYEGIKRALDNDEYMGIECDIRETLDKQYIINHNSIIDSYLIRFTNLNVLKSKYSITTLENILSIKTNKIILFEIKDYSIDIDSFLKLLDKYKNKNIYIMSFYKRVIKEIKRRSNKYKLGVLNYVLNSDKEYNNYDFICLLSSVITPNLYNYFLNNNIEVFIYGINNYNKLKFYSKSYLIVDNKKISGF